MHASLKRRRPLAWRRASLLATVALVVTSAAGLSGASGANNRLAYVGSPPAPATAPDPTTVGTLTFTPVTAGGATKVEYLVHSYDNQSLTHAFLDLPSTTVPQPAGLTVATVYGANEGDCDWTVGGTSVSCDFQKLTPKKPDRSITVVWNVAQDFVTTATPVFTASLQVNEQTNPNGTNIQVYQANSGTAAVGAADDDKVQTFVPPNSAQTVATTATGSGNPQSTSILLPPKANGYAATVQDEKTQGPTTDCANLPGNKFGDPCVGFLSETFVNGGQSFAPGYLEWTVTLQIPACTNQITVECWETKHTGGIVHYLYEGAFDASSFEVIPFDKQHQCKTSGAQSLPCWTLPTGQASIYNESTQTLSVVIRTDHNGGSKYF